MDGATRMSLRDKSAENFNVALKAFKEDNFNAAANRFYYSLYGAIVFELEENKGKAIRDYNEKQAIARERAGRKDWPHDIITKNVGNDLNLGTKEKSVLSHIFGQRIKADYLPEPVKKTDLKECIDIIEGILNGLGVSIS